MTHADWREIVRNAIVSNTPDEEVLRLRLRKAIAAKSEEGAQAIAALEEEQGELDLDALVDLLLEHGCKAEGTE